MLFKCNAVEIKLERLLLYLKRIRTRTAKPPSVHLIWGQPSKPLKEKKDPCDNVTRVRRLMNVRVFSGKIKTIRNLADLQFAKKVVSDSPGLVDFAIGLAKCS